MVLHPVISILREVFDFIIYSLVILYTSSYYHFRRHLLVLNYWLPTGLLVLIVRIVIKSSIFVILGLVLVVVQLATVVIRKLGEFSNFSKLIEWTISASFGRENIEEFRDGLVGIIDKVSDDKNEEASIQELMKLQHEAKRKFQDGELIFTGVVGGLIIFYQAEFAVISIPVVGTLSVVKMVEAYLIVLGLLTAYRVAFIDVLAYSYRERNRVSGAEIAWQRMITLRPKMQLLVLLGATIKLLSESAFQNALTVLEERYTQDLSWAETVESAWRKAR